MNFSNFAINTSSLNIDEKLDEIPEIIFASNVAKTGQTIQILLIVAIALLLLVIIGMVVIKRCSLRRNQATTSPQVIEVVVKENVASENKFEEIDINKK